MLKFTWLNLLVSAALALPASAQWLNYPTPGIPRTADGKPNLSAPAPRTADGKPDLSGLWRATQAAAGDTDKALKSVKAQPWAEELSKKRKEDLGREDMSVLCLPFGPRADMGVGKIIQTPGLVMLAFNDLTYRQVFLDGRAHPANWDPTWLGHSLGKWDGDALVVDTVGFNDRSWIGGLGDGYLPHTEMLHVTERYRRVDFGHMDVAVTFDDPGTFVKPFHMNVKLNLAPQEEVMEYVCENNRPEHLVGK